MSLAQNVWSDSFKMVPAILSRRPVIDAMLCNTCAWGMQHFHLNNEHLLKCANYPAVASAPGLPL